MKDLVIERNQYKSALEFQNETLLNDSKKYEERLKTLPKQIEKITTRYKVIYENIDEWDGDKNATDCQNARDFLTGFNY